jgi:hypothetical protein
MLLLTRAISHRSWKSKFYRTRTLILSCIQLAVEVVSWSYTARSSFKLTFPTVGRASGVATNGAKSRGGAIERPQTLVLPHRVVWSQLLQRIMKSGEARRGRSRVAAGTATSMAGVHGDQVAQCTGSRPLARTTVQGCARHLPANTTPPRPRGRIQGFLRALVLVFVPRGSSTL